jgi:DNA-binding NarL/FixJ family response regulator
MKILFVDDKTILLDGISKLLEKSAHELVEKTNSIDEALQYFEETEFDILISDFNLVDDNGLDLIRKVKKIYPGLKIIVLSMHDEAHLAEEIIKEGVDGYLLKKDSHHDLVEALETIDKGKVYLSDEINQILQKALDHNVEADLLTKKEHEVLQQIAENDDIGKIAEHLSVSKRTIESHRKRLFKKTKTSSNVGLLKYAYANNLI